MITNPDISLRGEVRELLVSATCPAVKPLHPTTPPDGWPTLELLFSARIGETTLDFEEKKVISNYGQIRKMLIFAILEISSGIAGAGGRGVAACAVTGAV